MAIQSGDFQEALFLQLCGVTLWHMIGVLIIHALGAFVLFNTQGVLGWVLVPISQLIFLGGLHAVRSPSEVPPIHHPKIGLHRSSILSLLASRLVLRGRTTDFLRSLAFYGACFGAALMYMLVYAGGSRWSTLFAAALSFSFCIRHFTGAHDALIFPVIQKRRFFRVKSSCTSVGLDAAKLAAASTLLAFLATYFLPLALPSSLGHLVSSILTALLVSCCWYFGTLVHHVVLTERLPVLWFNLGAIIEALRQDDAVLQDVALLELASASEDGGSRGRKFRSLMFLDSSGSLYLRPLLEFCKSEVLGFTLAVAKSLPSKSGNEIQQSHPSSIKWNVTSPSSLIKPLASPDHGAVHWLVRSSYQRQTLCIRALTALMAASREEDEYAVMQLATPSLFDCLAVLLACVLSLRQYRRHMYATPVSSIAPNWRPLAAACQPGTSSANQPPADPAAAALEDVASRAVQVVASTFKSNQQELVAGVQRVKAALPYGSAAEAASLLQAFFAPLD